MVTLGKADTAFRKAEEGTFPIFRKHDRFHSYEVITTWLLSGGLRR
jgi:hypothetical protein